MYYRLIALGVGLLMVCQYGYAQSAITGLVLDRANKPLTGVNVLLLRSSDSSLQKGMVTDEKGAYAFARVRPGSYLLAFSASGYEIVYSPMLSFSGGEKKDLGVQQLAEARREMAQVTVIAKKPLFEQKIDRMVVNVEGNITAAGSTILDVLERSPGVIVDRQNNSISL
ncbi:MAG: carboxypeptidase regulatory-like domain-containing protein, partial [Bacteroidetes bacterium]|nr:carboxypeptidase regulatory-like domain-containing protein [Bacteroidota bacterium]